MTGTVGGGVGAGLVAAVEAAVNARVLLRVTTVCGGVSVVEMSCSLIFLFDRKSNR